MDKNLIFEAAIRYRNAGRDVILVHPVKKYPVGFENWQTREFSNEELKEWITNKGYGIGIRNLEVLDFDNVGNPNADECYNDWCKLVSSANPNLLNKLVIEKTQHEGYHVGWLCEAMDNSKKIASRKPTAEELEKEPKLKSVVLIETRGKGGLFVASPTPGYHLIKGDWANMPTISCEERELLINSAKFFDKMPKTVDHGNSINLSDSNVGDRPGDFFNRIGIDESLELLLKNGWDIVYKRENTYFLRRPGKDKGISATLGYVAPGLLYNFSSNAHPFEPSRSYTPFAIYSLLMHEGDYSAAAKEIANRFDLKKINNTTVNKIDILWPEPISEAALHGVAGLFVKTVEPHTEADPVALLLNFIIAFGSIVGDKPHIKIGAKKHTVRLFSVLVGETAKGRKGESWGYPKAIFGEIDLAWGLNISSGMSSGEGLIYAVRDATYKSEPIKEKKVVIDYQKVINDEGVSDKRLLVVEEEFATILRRLDAWDGNTLSAIIRSAWDTGDLKTLTKNSPLKATGAHISIIGHITKDELLRYLTFTETANGFGNRFLWACVKRSKFLPFGGKLSNIDYDHLKLKISEAVTFAQKTDELHWSDDSKPIWEEIYPKLSEGKPGMVGAMTSRAEAIVVRLACIYALLDLSTLILPNHIKAALGVWKYADDSVNYIFQKSSGDPIATKILEMLEGKEYGLSRTEINKFFNGNISKEQIKGALIILEKLGRITKKIISTNGRNEERWYLA